MSLPRYAIELEGEHGYNMHPSRGHSQYHAPYAVALMQHPVIRTPTTAEPQTGHRKRQGAGTFISKRRETLGKTDHGEML